MVKIACEIDTKFTSKRAKQYIKGLQGIVCNHGDGLMTDQQMVNAVVQKSLQMLVFANVVQIVKEKT